MLLVDTKVDVQYKNGGITMERIPNGVYKKIVLGGSGKDGIGA